MAIAPLLLLLMVLGIVAALAGFPGTGVTLTVPAIATALWAFRRMKRDIEARLDQAIQAADAPPARELFEELALPEGFQRDWLEAQVLALEGRFEEARTKLASVVDRCRDEPAPFIGELMESNLAVLTAQAGDPEGATPRAERAIETVPASLLEVSDKLSSLFTANLGIVLALAGRWDESAGLLENAAQQDVAPSLQAPRLFYLGESFRALGRSTEARDCFERTAALAPRCHWGRRAQEHLAQPEAPLL